MSFSNQVVAVAQEAYLFLDSFLRPAVRGLLLLHVLQLSESQASHAELLSVAQSLESPSASLQSLLDGYKVRSLPCVCKLGASHPGIILSTSVRCLPSLQLTASSGRQALGETIQQLVQNPSLKDDGPFYIFAEFMLKLIGKLPDKAWSKVS